MKSFLDLLAGQETLSEKGQGYFSHVQKAADRMAALIDTVYFYTRLDGSPRDIRAKPAISTPFLEEVKENLAVLIRESGATITFAQPCLW